MPPTPVLQWQLISPEPVQATAFYEKAFGWRFDSANALGYRALPAQPPGIGGGIWPAPPGVNAFVQLFIGVDDVVASVEACTRLGAQLIVPVSTLPDGAVMAVLRDPQGVSFGLMQQPAA